MLRSLLRKSASGQSRYVNGRKRRERERCIDIPKKEKVERRTKLAPCVDLDCTSMDDVQPVNVMSLRGSIDTFRLGKRTDGREKEGGS
jgi:hypothetical protein